MEKFEHPFTCIVAGATGSGKTVFVRSLLSCHQLVINGIPSSSKPKVLWCYGIKQPLHHQPIEEVDVTYSEGMNEDEIAQYKPDILIVDDLMQEKSGDQSLSNLFTRGSHHLGMSIIFIVQNFFAKGSKMRTISLNAKYIVLMKNPRDKSQVYTLGRQLFPDKHNYFREAYEEATRDPYGYLLIDLTQECNDQRRLRTDIFRQHPNYGYIPTYFAPR